MKKKLAILGSTGSIGKSLLKIINDNKNKFEDFWKNHKLKLIPKHMAKITTCNRLVF